MESSEKSHPPSCDEVFHQPQFSADASFNAARTNPNRFPLPPGVYSTEDYTRADYLGVLRVRQLYENEEWEYRAWRDWRRWVIFVVVVVVLSGISFYRERPFFPDWACLIFILVVFACCLWIKDFLRNWSSPESVDHIV
jgi:hypothetical protein